MERSGKHMLTRFFFDVADVDYIKDKWGKIASYCNPHSVVGVTTNPGIWNKAGITDFNKMICRLTELVDLITEIRNDDSGVVYVQPPYSKMPNDEINKFIQLILPCGNGHTKIGCKLPPYYGTLCAVADWKKKYDIDFNVTGIADCSTALMAASYNVKYISIIPGRMEEAGIDAFCQINYVRHARLGNTEIITGAMRTVDCLRWVCQCGTIPTIGTRVWDKIFTEIGASNFCKLWEPSCNLKEMPVSPMVDTAMTNLSIDFFKQMDELGRNMYAGFREQI